MKKLILCLVIFCAITTAVTARLDDEAEAKKYVDEVCEIIKMMSYRTTSASWNYESNITDYNRIKNNEAQEKFAEYTKSVAFNLMKYNYESFKNRTLLRLIKKMVDVGDDILNNEDFRALNNAIAKMQENYAKVKIPSYRNPNVMVQLEPELTEILVESSDPNELEYYWTHWYDLAGTPSKENFFKYVELKNKAARLNHFRDTAEAWLSDYEDPSFEKQIADILEQMLPLYRQFHGYVRQKLFDFYGPEHINLNKPIPMHLLGNVWGQKWDLGDKVKPYINAPKQDVTKELIKQGYTPKNLFEASEEFYLSINLTKMPDSFWQKSIIEKPRDGRDMICHASAWDFLINNDVRIKQCTRVSMESFITIHHEMGHVEYYLQYNIQPKPFREGANPGFHEAIGDTIALSVSTPKHLHRVGLLAEVTEDYESLINNQFEMGIQKLAFIPFAYIMDKFRYDVFRGNVNSENANCHFWRLREKYGGIGPASKRSNRDFDITAKYHASADVEYMRYVVSNIIQFQFHKAACIKAGEYEPNNPAKTLHNCDIYHSANAGNALKEMLALGSSKPWPDALEVMTGERILTADAILEYFKPLSEWLEKTNNELGVKIGWESSDNLDCS